MRANHNTSPIPEKGPAIVYQHPRASVRLVDPVTAESVDNAKKAARKEKLYAYATMRASEDNITLATAQPHVRAAYLEAATLFLSPIKVNL